MDGLYAFTAHVITLRRTNLKPTAGFSASGQWPVALLILLCSQSLFSCVQAAEGEMFLLSIIDQPQSLTAANGAEVNLTVGVSGLAPFLFQWRLEGANLADATNSTLALGRVQAANAGAYDVVVSNGGGSVTSAVATLTLMDMPMVQQPPQYQIVASQGQAAFSVAAVGGAPMNYQWQWNGVDLVSATNPVLTLANVQPKDAGSYRVLISNPVGSVLSPEAKLWVVDDYSTVTSIMPANYLPQTSFTVKLLVLPGPTAVGYVVTDTPPPGWLVTAISDNGQMDGSRVAWGPFQTAESKIISYEVVAPQMNVVPSAFSGSLKYVDSLLSSTSLPRSIVPIIGNREISLNANFMQTLVEPVEVSGDWNMQMVTDWTCMLDGQGLSFSQTTFGRVKIDQDGVNLSFQDFQTGGRRSGLIMGTNLAITSMVSPPIDLAGSYQFSTNTLLFSGHANVYQTRINLLGSGEASGTFTSSDGEVSILTMMVTSRLTFKRTAFGLTFYDGPVRGNTEKVFEALKRYEVNGKPLKAGFFQIGLRVRDNPDLTRRVVAEGHFVGNHSWQHLQMDRWAQYGYPSEAAFNQDEIIKGDAELDYALGYTPLNIYHPPYVTTSNSFKATENLGFSLTQGYDILDTLYDTNRVRANALAALATWSPEEPCFLCFHDSMDSTCDTIGDTIDFLVASGYHLANFDPGPLPQRAPFTPFLKVRCLEGNFLEIAWNSAARNFLLQSTISPSQPDSWSNLGNGNLLLTNRVIVPFSTLSAEQVFRLQKQ